MTFGAMALNEEMASPAVFARAAQREVLALPGVARLKNGLLRRLLGMPSVRVRIDGKGRFFVDADIVIHFGAPARPTAQEAAAAIRSALEHLSDRPIAALTVRVAGVALEKLDYELL